MLHVRCQQCEQWSCLHEKCSCCRFELQLEIRLKNDWHKSRNLQCFTATANLPFKNVLHLQSVVGSEPFLKKKRRLQKLAIDCFELGDAHLLILFALRRPVLDFLRIKD